VDQTGESEGVRSRLYRGCSNTSKFSIRWTFVPEFRGQKSEYGIRPGQLLSPILYHFSLFIWFYYVFLIIFFKTGTFLDFVCDIPPGTEENSAATRAVKYTRHLYTRTLA